MYGNVPSFAQWGNMFWSPVVVLLYEKTAYWICKLKNAPTVNDAVLKIQGTYMKEAMWLFFVPFH